MATIRTRELADETVVYQVLFRDRGKQRSLTFDTPAGAQNAVNLIDRFGAQVAIALLDAQATGSDGGETVTDLVRDHVVRLRGITAGTRKDYTSMVERRIAPAFIGELPIDLVTKDHVTAWLDGLEAAGLSSKTRKNHHALLSAAFETAIDRQKLARNPARGIDIPKTEADSGRTFLNPGEAAILVSALAPRWQPFVITLLGTGLRFGEATALQVGDVDLDAPTPVLHVRRAWKRSGKGAPTETGAPKTKAGVRTVSLGAGVVEVLRPLVDGRGAKDLVFTAVEGGPIRHDHFHARVWKPALDRTPELRKRPTIHSLRHTHVSALIQSGVPLTVIQHRLGHESIQTTSDTYGHLAPDALAVSAYAIDRWMAQVTPEIES